MTLIGFGLIVVAGLAQSQDAGAPAEPRLVFDAASIKPADPGGRGMGLRYLPGGRLVAQNASLHFLIQAAYRVRDFQVNGGPAWMNTEAYDITAKAEDGAQQTQLPLMLQALLADRFQLAFHRETREMPVFLLTVAKGGMKLVEPKEGSCVRPGPEGLRPTPGQPQPNPCGMMRISPQGLDGWKIGIEQLTLFFSDVLGRAVIDKTDFKGTFDAHLEFARDQSLARGILGGAPPNAAGEPQAAPVDSSPSIFTAAQEQLGLKLESAKGPVEVLVIDHVDKPSEN